MPCLSRPRQVHAISSNPFWLRNSALDLWLSFCYQSIIPLIEIRNRSCSRQSCKEIPTNRYSRPKDLEDKNSFDQWQVRENSLRIEAWKRLPRGSYPLRSAKRERLRASEPIPSSCVSLSVSLFPLSSEEASWVMGKLRKENGTQSRRWYDRPPRVYYISLIIAT